MSGGVEVGTCGDCGQQMLRTDDDCWHPHDVAVACPPEPATDPYDATGWQAFYAAGLKPNRPGRDKFRPMTTIVGGSGLGILRTE